MIATYPQENNWCRQKQLKCQKYLWIRYMQTKFQEFYYPHQGLDLYKMKSKDHT